MDDGMLGLVLWTTMFERIRYFSHGRLRWQCLHVAIYGTSHNAERGSSKHIGGKKLWPWRQGQHQDEIITHTVKLHSGLCFVIRAYLNKIRHPLFGRFAEHRCRSRIIIVVYILKHRKLHNISLVKIKITCYISISRMCHSTIC